MKIFSVWQRIRVFFKELSIKGDSLEGYLAPDTYYYSKEVDVDVFIEAIAKKTFKIFAKEDIKKRMEELHFDIHKTLTLASIIEREAKLKEEKPLISAVFHNRLKRGMPLDADPTVIYGTGAFNEPIKKIRSNHLYSIQYLHLYRAPQGAHMQSGQKLHHGSPLPCLSRFIFILCRRTTVPMSSRRIWMNITDL
ncbi:MAG: endolytic transglycosylase MltG [Desulfomicrobium escambiense]|nr:endolytic transglycosylase MltG [Desulfomicrobium escambiense]